MTPTIKQRALAAGLHPNTVYERTRRGETLEQALSRPAKRYGVLAPAVLACVEAHPGLTAQEIAERIGERREAVRLALLALTRRGRLERTEARAIVRGRSQTVQRYALRDDHEAEPTAAAAPLAPAKWVHPIRARALAGRAA